jgi:putative transposase
MPYNKKVHHRRSIRLPGYDYASAGAYFVTICVRGGECLLGEVVDGEMHLNEWGQIAHTEWLASQEIRRELKLDAFVVMPNHLHGIVWITRADPVGAPNSAPKHAHNRETPVGAHGGAPNSAPLQRPPKSLGSFIAGYKTVVTTRINQLRDTPGLPFWQRNYWEHIIRDERSLKRIREYIENNPARWAEDQLHPDAPPNPFNRWTP